MKRGFVLLELIVALVVLTVGLLGIAGSALQASRILTRAAEVEYSVAVAEGVADSLMAFGMSRSDSALTPVGAVVWQLRPDGALQVVVRGSDGTRVDFWALEATHAP